MLRLVIAMMAAFGLSSTAVAENLAAKTSPVFGGGNVTPMTTTEMRQTIAKGYSSYYYGYYGWNYAYSAYVNGYNALYVDRGYYQNALDYAQARDQASNASYWLYYAARS